MGECCCAVRLSVALVLAGYSAVVTTTGVSMAQSHSNIAASQRESIRRFLQTWDRNKNKATQYIAAFPDLNGDGVPEAIVYLANGWCGNGGCNTLILAKDSNSWRVVTNITITRPPIRVLASSSRGWHDIGVWVQGGGIQPGYEAELRFDGHTYPRNPSVPPARRLSEKVAGEVMIPSAQGAEPLYQ
jgi:hypothetical protein